MKTNKTIKFRERFKRKKKRKALIIDIDNTLSELSHRLHLFTDPNPNWTLVNNESIRDSVNKWCKDIVKLFHSSKYRILFVTARGDTARAVTEQWLKKHLPNVDWLLYMRKNGDERTDDLIKKDIYNKHLKDKFNILFAIDDSLRVATMWRSLGLVCLHCNSDSPH